MEEYRLAVKGRPKNAFYRYKLGAACAQAGQIEDAETELQKAIQLAPNDAFYHFWLADFYGCIDRVDEQIRELTEATRLAPCDPYYHELRTPIASIRVMAESLQAGASEDPVLRERFVNAIQESTNRLAALVDDLMTLSSLESQTHAV